MADIDIVIKIPEEVYKKIKETCMLISGSRGSKRRFDYILFNAVNDSTPLPKGEWLRMSDLSQDEDDRYQCSRCGNVVRHRDKMNLYTFNSWCGRCGSYNGRKPDMTNFIDNFELREEKE